MTLCHCMLELYNLVLVVFILRDFLESQNKCQIFNGVIIIENIELE